MQETNDSTESYAATEIALNRKAGKAMAERPIPEEVMTELPSGSDPRLRQAVCLGDPGH